MKKIFIGLLTVVGAISIFGIVLSMFTTFALVEQYNFNHANNDW